MKISFLITICLISTLTTYDLDNILSFMRMDLGLEFRNGDKFIKFISIERFRRDWTTIYLRGIFVVVGVTKEPLNIDIGGMVT
jgi:hypothetical protein